MPQPLQRVATASALRTSSSLEVAQATKEEAGHAGGVGGAAELKHRENLRELGDPAGDQLVRLAQRRSASHGGAELRAAAAHGSRAADGTPVPLTRQAAHRTARALFRSKAPKSTAESSGAHNKVEHWHWQFGPHGTSAEHSNPRASDVNAMETF